MAKAIIRGGGWGPHQVLEPCERTESVAVLTSQTDSLLRPTVPQSKSSESSVNLNNFPTDHNYVSQVEFTA